MKNMKSSRNIAVTSIAVFLTLSLFAQEEKKDVTPLKTKMDVFTSKTGVIRKFVDINLSGLRGSYLETAETRIRKVSSSTVALYFYQIEKKGKYNSSTASIEYIDLLEIIKALTTLTAEVEKDIASNPDYLENKFITVDGFEVGYYVSKSKANWYIKLEKYGSDNTLFVNSAAVLETAFNEGKNRIEVLKK